MRLCALVVGIILSLSATGPHAAPIVAGYERFGRQAPDEAARVEAGLLLLGELGCVNCHAAGEPAAAHLAAKAGPGWAKRTAYNRGQILYRLGEMLEARRAEMIDVQMESPHVARFGARGIPHGEFMARLARALAPPPG